MGRIRTTQIKTLSKELLSYYPDRFSHDFEHNKKTLDELGIESKWLRNKVAGYISNLKGKNVK